MSCKSSPWLAVIVLLGSFLISANASPYGLDARPQVSAFLNGTMPEVAPAISGNWSAVVAFTNLLFTNSVGLTSVPGTDQLCVWEREGRVWTFQNSPGTTRKKLVLDLHNQCQGWDDSGLLGRGVPSGLRHEPFHFRLLHLGQAGHGRRRSPTRARIQCCPTPTTTGSRASPSTRTAWPFPARETVFMDLTDQTVWHHGGGMFFHPTNGFLY